MFLALANKEVTIYSNHAFNGQRFFFLNGKNCEFQSISQNDNLPGSLGENHFSGLLAQKVTRNRCAEPPVRFSHQRDLEMDRAGLEMTWDHPGVATVACTTAEMVDEGRFQTCCFWIYGYDFFLSRRL